MKTSLTLDSVPKKTNNYVIREMPGEALLVDIGEKYQTKESNPIGSPETFLYRMNNTGFEVFKLINGKRKVKDILGNIKNNYGKKLETSKVIEKDVLSFLRLLLKSKAIEIK